MSMQIGDERLFPAVRNRPDGAAVLACGFSCRHQIADGTGVKALHWVQTLRAVKPSEMVRVELSPKELNKSEENVRELTVSCEPRRRGDAGETDHLH